MSRALLAAPVPPRGLRRVLSRVRRRWTTLGTSWFTAAAVVVVPALARADVDHERIVQDEAYWVSTAQLTCAGDGRGAIAESAVRGSGRVSVHPYEANLGARAMLAAGPRYVPMVGAWIRWYLGHLNRPDESGVAGTVYDHDYNPVTCEGAFQPHPVTGAVPKYDSTDAYAGTFLTLVAEYARAPTADRAYLASAPVRRDLELVADVIGATRGPSGLSGATPTYPAEFLMDNVEAHRGLADYAWLLGSVLGDPAGAQRRTDEAAAVARAIEARLWEDSTAPGMYGWAADQLSPSWDTWFPDAMAQLWPIWDGLGPVERREGLWDAFVARYPDWAASTPLYGSVSVAHDPHAATAYAAARAGDRAAVDTYLWRSEQAWAAAGRPAPWTVDDAGFRALAARAALGG